MLCMIPYTGRGKQAYGPKRESVADSDTLDEDSVTSSRSAATTCTGKGSRRGQEDEDLVKDIYQDAIDKLFEKR